MHKDNDNFTMDIMMLLVIFMDTFLCKIQVAMIEAYLRANKMFVDYSEVRSMFLINYFGM